MAIVLDDALRERHQEHRAYSQFWRVGVALDVLVFHKIDFYKRIQLVSSLKQSIPEEGRAFFHSGISDEKIIRMGSAS